MTARTTFDATYYRRFYGGRPVHTKNRVGRLATAVDGLCAWWGLNVTSVLDVGAGPGYWRDWYAAHRPKVEYRSTDVSEYACRTWGHEQLDIVTWEPDGTFDLVICHGVLHYLADADAEAAIGHLASATAHVIYLEIPTADDLAHVVDREATDLEVYERSGDWYRERLEPRFFQAGAGLWGARSGDLVMYELERGR